MNARPTQPSVQLLVYEFPPDAKFEGQLGGAIGRVESGGALRVLEAVFVQREADTGELVVLDLRGDGVGGIVAPVLDFRLDPGARRRSTERSLADDSAGLSAEVIGRLGAQLAPGAAIGVLLVEHLWAATLFDAVERTAGVLRVSTFVSARELSEVADLLLETPDRGGAEPQ